MAIVTETSPVEIDPAPDAPVILEARQVVDGGKGFVVNGLAEPGSTLAIRIDDSSATTVTVEADGRWTATIPVSAPGDYTLSVTAVSEGMDATGAGTTATVKLQIEVVGGTEPAVPAPELPPTGRGMDDALLPIMLILGGVLALLTTLSIWDVRQRRSRL